MRRYRSTVLMALLFLALLGYLFLIEIPQQREEEETELAEQKAFSIDKDDILSLTIRGPEETITIEKRDNTLWEVTHPMRVKASDAEIKNLISTITDMRIRKVITESNEEPSDFGFDHPYVSISVMLSDRVEEVTLGDDAPVNNVVYVKKGSTGRVLLADQWIKDSLLKTFFDLRDKSMVSAKTGSINEILLDFPDKSIRLFKKNDHWNIVEPVTTLADQEAIQSLLFSVSNLQASGFVDREEDKKETWLRLQGKDLMVTINTDKDIETVSFHRIEKDRVMAITHKNRPIYEVSASTLNQFSSELFYYIDKHLITFEASEAHKVDVTTPTESYTLIRAGERWSIEGRQETLDQGTVESFLVDLNGTEAKQAPDKPLQPPNGGLDSSKTEVRLYNAADKPIASLTLGAESSGLLFAKGSPELGIVMISPDILDQIPRTDELIKAQADEDSPQN